MTHVICSLTAKNRDQLRNPTLGNRVWATFTFIGPYLIACRRCAGAEISSKIRLQAVVMSIDNDQEPDKKQQKDNENSEDDDDYDYGYADARSNDDSGNDYNEVEVEQDSYYADDVVFDWACTTGNDQSSQSPIFPDTGRRSMK